MPQRKPGETIEFKSSVLGCDVGEDGCSVCEFLNGSRDAETMVEVIRILDSSLAESERVMRSLSELMSRKFNNANT